MKLIDNSKQQTTTTKDNNMTLTNENFTSEALLQLRYDLRLTMHEMAKLLEVSQKTICNWEKGTVTPRKSKILKIQKILSKKLKDKKEYIAFKQNNIKNQNERTCSEIQKIVILQFKDKSEIYNYNTKNLLEYIAENKTVIVSIKICECKNKILDNQDSICYNDKDNNNNEGQENE